MDQPKKLQEQINTAVVTNDGWEVLADNDKLGYVAMKANALFEMKLSLDNTTMDIVQTVNFMVMRSYGDKWGGSKVHVDAYIYKSGTEGKEEEEVTMAPTKSMEIVGYHDKETSETYNYKIDFGEEGIAVGGETLHICVELVGGSTFKFRGVAICDL
eukprot:11599131-Ditylum_brightwellii.AAC.1